MKTELTLFGIRVLDCSQLLPGPLIGKLLAEQGATVLKVENPDRPDPALEMANGVYYQDLNRLKTRVHFDLSLPEEQTRFQTELKTADILIEGFRPRVRTKLGLDPKELLRLYPKLIVLSLSGFPHDSPEANRPAHDLGFQARAGLLSLGAALPGIPLSDIVPPYRATYEILAALFSRTRSGRGTHLEVSILDSLKEIQSKWVAEFQASRQLPEPGSTLVTGCFPCYEIYRTADGRKISVSAMEEPYWKLFCQTLALEQYSNDGYSKGARAQDVKAAIQTKIGQKSFEAWKLTFESVECCVEPVLNYEEIFSLGL